MTKHLINPLATAIRAAQARVAADPTLAQLAIEHPARVRSYMRALEAGELVEDQAATQAQQGQRAAAITEAQRRVARSPVLRRLVNEHGARVEKILQGATDAPAAGKSRG